LGDLDSDETTLVVLSDSAVVFVESGYRVYVRDATLLAHPFDPDVQTLTGEPLALAIISS
jgi:hypothetical protein